MLSKEDHEQVVFDQCRDFDIFEAIRLQLKSQPQSNKEDEFEEENEPTLQHISSNIFVIKDR